MEREGSWRIGPAGGLIVLLLLVTFFFTVLAVRTQTNISEIKRNSDQIAAVQDAREKALKARAVKDYDQCTDVRDFHAAFKDLLVSIIQQVKSTPATATFNAEARAAALAKYEALLAHTRVPDCGPAPSP